MDMLAPPPAGAPRLTPAVISKMVKDLRWELSRKTTKLNATYRAVEHYKSQLDRMTKIADNYKSKAHNYITELRMYDALAYHEPHNNASFTCPEVVLQPLDAPPVRSPQAVHTALLRHVRGKRLVEFGTRTGDG